MTEIIEELNVLREALLKKFLLFFSLSVVVSGSLASLFNSMFVFFFATVVLAMMSYAYFYNKFDKKVHEMLFKRLSNIYDEVTLTFEGLSRERVSSSKMIPRGDSFSSHYKISVDSDALKSQYAYVKITERRGSGKSRRTVTLFAGSYLIFEFGVALSGRHHIKESTALFFKSKNKFRFEDQDFMDKFQVTSTDEFELFKLLTPSIILLLKHIEREHPGTIQYCFFGEELHIAIGGVDKKLSVSLFTALDDSYIQDIIKEIDFLKAFMTTLKKVDEKFDQI